MTGELAPWEVAVSADVAGAGPNSLIRGVALAAAMMGAVAVPARRQSRYRPIKVASENPNTKRKHKAQRAARKARRRGETKA